MNALCISLAAFALVVVLSGWAYRVNFPERHRAFGDFSYRWFETIILFGLCGIPTWTLLAATHFLTSDGFWQQSIAFCCGVVLVLAQLVCFLLFFLGLCETWKQPKF